MPILHLRPIDLDRDLGELAALFTLVQDDPTTEAELRDDYETHKERIFCLNAAEDERGELLGFNWANRDRDQADKAHFYILVKPQRRNQGAGRLLYANAERAARAAGIRRIEMNVRDTDPPSRAFAERRGFSERTHSIAMQMDLDAFDDQPYNALISHLQDEGFEFTSMETLGNDEESQRRLFRLNDTAATVRTVGASRLVSKTLSGIVSFRICGSMMISRVVSILCRFQFESTSKPNTDELALTSSGSKTGNVQSEKASA